MPTRNQMCDESVDRALDVHTTDGLIRGWRRVERGYRLVDLSNGQTAELRTFREAHLFCYGLASASQAFRSGRATGR